MAQVTFIEDEFVGNGTDSSTSTTINKPTGTADGDLMITVAHSNVDITPTTLSGWTLLDTLNNADAGRTNVYWKIASSEGSDYTWAHTSLGASQAIQFHLSTWRNAHATTALAIYSKATDTNADTTSTGTTITTTTAPHGVLMQIHGFNNHASAAFSAYAIANDNPTWDERVDQTTVNSAGQATLAIATASYDFAQATGAVTATISQTGESNVFLIFIKPAGFTFAVPTATMTGTLIAPSLAAAISVATLASAAFTTYAPAIATADPEVVNVTKNAAAMANTSKNAASATNQSKNSSSWTNQSKS